MKTKITLLQVSDIEIWTKTHQMASIWDLCKLGIFLQKLYDFLRLIVSHSHLK